MNNEYMPLTGKISLPKVVSNGEPQELTKDVVESVLFEDVPETEEITDEDQFVICQENEDDKVKEVGISKRIPVNSLRNKTWVGMALIPDKKKMGDVFQIGNGSISGSGSLKVGDVGTLYGLYNPEEVCDDYTKITDVRFFQLIFGRIKEIKDDGLLFDIEVVDAIDFPDFTGLDDYVKNFVGSMKYGESNSQQKQMLSADGMLFQACGDFRLYSDSIGTFYQFLRDEMNKEDHDNHVNVISDGVRYSSPTTHNQFTSNQLTNVFLVIYDQDDQITRKIHLRELAFLLKNKYGFVMNEP